MSSMQFGGQICLASLVLRLGLVKRHSKEIMSWRQYLKQGEFHWSCALNFPQSDFEAYIKYGRGLASKPFSFFRCRIPFVWSTGRWLNSDFLFEGSGFEIQYMTFFVYEFTLGVILCKRSQAKPIYMRLLHCFLSPLISNPNHFPRMTSNRVESLKTKRGCRKQISQCREVDAYTRIKASQTEICNGSFEKQNFLYRRHFTPQTINVTIFSIVSQDAEEVQEEVYYKLDQASFIFCSGTKWCGNWTWYWLVQFFPGPYHSQLLYYVQVYYSNIFTSLLLCMGHRKVSPLSPQLHRINLFNHSWQVKSPQSRCSVFYDESNFIAL